MLSEDVPRHPDEGDVTTYGFPRVRYKSGIRISSFVVVLAS